MTLQPKAETREYRPRPNEDVCSLSLQPENEESDLGSRSCYGSSSEEEGKTNLIRANKTVKGGSERQEEGSESSKRLEVELRCPPLLLALTSHHPYEHLSPFRRQRELLLSCPPTPFLHVWPSKRPVLPFSRRSLPRSSRSDPSKTELSRNPTSRISRYGRKMSREGSRGS